MQTQRWQILLLALPIAVRARHMAIRLQHQSHKRNRAVASAAPSKRPLVQNYHVRIILHRNKSGSVVRAKPGIMSLRVINCRGAQWLARQKDPQKQTYAAQQNAAYSITSSAATSSLSGTVSPRALTVFRLITSSNLVGSVIGKSAGFSPLRMRPA